MKIDKLHIHGFGVFHDKNIQGFTKGINVLYGANEAGKSTLLDFIRFTLFEYPRWHHERRQPLMGGTHSGRIWLNNSAGESLSVYRHGNAKDFQLEYNGETSENESRYKNLIGNASIGLYKNIYAITLDELTDVDQLGDSGMEDRIFSMGMGLSGVDFGGFEKSLVDHSEDYFKTRGSVQVLPKLVSEINSKEEAINKLRSKLGEYYRLSENKEQLEAELDELKESRAKLSQENNQFSDLSRAYPDYVKYKDAENQIKEIGKIEIHPVQILEQYEAQKQMVSNEETAITQITQQIQQLEEELDQLKWDGELSKQSGLLDFFKTNVKLYEEAKSKLNQDEEKLTNAKSNSETVLRRLGEGLNTTHLIELQGTFEIQSKASHVVEEQQILERLIGTKTEVESRLLHELSEVETRKDRLEHEIESHSIKNHGQRESANDKRITLDTAFKVALENRGGSVKKQNKLPLILSIVFLAVGGLLLVVDYVSGGIVLGIASVSLIAVLMQKNNDSMDEVVGRNPNDINKELTALTEAVLAYDQLIVKHKELAHQHTLKNAEVLKINEELKLLKAQLSALQNEWKAILDNQQLPTTLSPARMNDFITNVEELKRQNTNQVEAEKAIQNSKKLISEFEEKLKQISPDKTDLDVPYVYSLITKIEENEQINYKRNRLVEQINSFSKEKELKVGVVHKVSDQITEYFSTLKVKDEVAFYQHYELQKALEKAMSEKLNAANTIKTLCGEDQLEQTLIKLAGFTPSELTIRKEETESEYENVKNKYDELNKSLASTTTEIRHILELDDMYGLQNEKESLQAQLKEETKEWLTTKLALEVLSLSKQKYEKERQPEVITQTRDFFRTITENAYEDLRISLSEKHVSIIDAAGNSKTVQELSRGTREQLLLALRLGLIAEYEKNAEPLPVAFDDIMVNFDANRTNNLAKILTDFSKDRQVLYFTCHEHTKDLFAAHGANIIEW